MTKLEKIGLIIAIPAGIVTILEYIEKINFIKFIKDNFEWIPSKLKGIIVWFYENVILLEINIWIFLLLIFGTYKVNIFIKNKIKHNVVENQQNNLLDVFENLDKDSQLIFKYIAECENNKHSCTKDSIDRHFKNTDISAIESTSIIDTLIKDDLISAAYNMIHPTEYSLSKHGRSIVVEIIKSLKKEKGK